VLTTGVPNPSLDALRQRLRRLGGGVWRRRAVLPFGVAAIDNRLPDGRLALGALHEVAGVGGGAVDGAAAALFAVGIAARTQGHVLWCVTRQDLFAPALAAVGLAPHRVIYVDAEDEKKVLACFKEGLRARSGLGAMIAEVTRLSMTASRRLQLAAEESNAIGIAMRRLPAFMRRRGRGGDAKQKFGEPARDTGQDFTDPTAAVTRWRISALPSAPLPVAGVGRAHWRLDLVRCRGGEAARFAALPRGRGAGDRFSGRRSPL
jgi:protein ImuA